jgi:iron complex outermembrane receptor protein
MSIAMRAASALIPAALLAQPAFAQSTTPLPTVAVGANTAQAAPESSLTVPTVEEARRDIQQTPGGVALIPDTEFRNSPAATLKDVVDFVPGVWVQPKWGDDSRLSIRGSGLSRNFHLRSTQLFMDGIPINTSDGYGDFQEIDPTAYRYVEVFKGANALQYGANSLGGAINFVTPSGRDARTAEGRIDGGAYGFLRGQASSGGVHGPVDYFATGSLSHTDGYREHSWGDAARANVNVGYRFSPDAETRFYVNANHVRQRIPGEVTRTSALKDPTAPWQDNVTNDWQRNIDTVRVANKTTLRFDTTTVAFGAFGVDRHLQHPIFEWLDYRYADYGGFARAVDDRNVGGHRNRFVAGFNIINGTINADQYVNTGGNKGAMTKSLLQKPENYSAYVEDSLYVLPSFAVVAGAQYLYAVREQEVKFTAQGDKPGRVTFSLFSPKAGLLWDIDPAWQAYGNVSRSAEAPSFGEGGGASAIPFTQIKPQRATTYEIGTRGRRPDFVWDVSIYQANIRDELMCYFSAFGNCNVSNADRTIHRGVEVGFALDLLRGYRFAGADGERLWLHVAYTYSDFRFDRDATFGNNRLPGAPPHYMRGELIYKHPVGFSIGPTMEWVPEAYFVDSANTLKSAPYVLFGFKIGYETRDFSAYVEARNLANRAYIATTSIIDRATPDSRLFNPGTGRAVFAGLRRAW